MSDLGHIDGMDMWSTLVHNKESPRTEIFHNYDEREIYSALVMGSWKFVEGELVFDFTNDAIDDDTNGQ